MQRRQQSRTNSSIVRAFVQTTQELERREQEIGVAVITENSRKRREQIDKKASKKKLKEKKKEGAFKSAISKAESFRTMDEHKIPIEDLFKRLETSKDSGLTSSFASDLNRKLGDNVLTAKKSTPWYVKLFKEMTGHFALMLWIAAILSFVIYALSPADPSNLYIGVVLIIIVVVSALFTFYQNAQSESIMESFKNFIPPKTNCVRDGQWRSMDAAKLVPGDIIKVKMGDKIPADIRLFYSKDMKVDNSSLTGESEPLLRTTECTNKENPLETANIAFFGTLCKEGEGMGVVIKIADNTVIGQIAALAANASESEVTPLRQEINRFIAIIIWIALTTGVIFFFLGFLVGYGIITNFIFAVGIATAYVPEGLPAALAAALTITAKKLARKKVLVRNLESVETLGSTSCICSDKTGTLTQNIMTVQHLWYDGKLVFGENMQKKGPNFKYEYDVKSIGFKTLHECAMRCSDAYFSNATPEDLYHKAGEKDKDHPSEGDAARRKQIDEEYQKKLASLPYQERPTVGDASETGLIKFFQPIEDITTTRDRYKIKINNDHSESRIPFNSTNKFALVIAEYPTSDSEYCLFIKGAPERVWAMCDKIYINGKIQEIGAEWKKSYDAVNLQLAKAGERVLGFAKLHLPKSEYPKGFQFNCLNIKTFNVPLQSLAFIGLISLMDPPRDAVPFSVIKCKAAGIKVIMVTGDQPITAAAIAKKCNILSEKTPEELMEEQKIPYETALAKARAIVIHGDQLAAAMREDEGLPESEKGRKLAQWLHKPEIVFARTSPAQKLIIVEGNQKLGHVVAVTGDGVNDSPAIKKADIGVAMGVTGSDVAKDAADMILLTDDFTAIIIGVEEGRKIFDNLKKTIAYILTSNISELVPFIMFIFLQFQLPITAIIVLLISVGTDMLPCIAYVYEDGEPDLMTRPPRMKTEHMVTRKMIVFTYFTNGPIESLCAMTTYFVIINDFGFGFWSNFFVQQKKGYHPVSGDVFDTTIANFGNSDIYCQNGNLISRSNQGSTTPDYLSNADEYLDLRLFYVRCEGDHLVPTYDWGNCAVPQISTITLRPVCYTTEVQKFAASGFFYASVFTQMTNLIALRTRLQSIIYQGWNNFFCVFAIHFEAGIMLILGYVYWLDLALGLRDVVWWHLGIPSLALSIWLLINEEIRKFFIRSWPKPDPGKPNWFARNSLW